MCAVVHLVALRRRFKAYKSILFNKAFWCNSTTGRVCACGGPFFGTLVFRRCLSICKLSRSTESTQKGVKFYWMLWYYAVFSHSTDWDRNKNDYLSPSSGSENAAHYFSMYQGVQHLLPKFYWAYLLVKEAGLKLFQKNQRSMSFPELTTPTLWYQNIL